MYKKEYEDYIELILLAEEIKKQYVGDSISERSKINSVDIVNGLINLKLANELSKEFKENKETVEVAEEKKDTKASSKK